MAVDNIARGMAASALKNQGGGGSSLPIVNTAAIGQTIRVSAVDDAGKPTEWEAVEFPAGGGSDLTLLGTVTLEEDTGVFVMTEDEFPGITKKTDLVFVIDYTALDSAVTVMWTNLYEGDVKSIESEIAQFTDGISGGWITSVWASKRNGRWLSNSFESSNNVAAQRLGSPELSIRPGKGIINIPVGDFDALSIASASSVFAPKGTVITVWGWDE